MDILQFNEKKENNLCFDFLEEKIREESRRVIEAFYADEVNQYLNRMASLANENGNKLVVRNGTEHWDFRMQLMKYGDNLKSRDVGSIKLQISWTRCRSAYRKKRQK